MVKKKKKNHPEKTAHFLTSNLTVDGCVCLEISSTHCWAIGAGEMISVALDGVAGLLTAQ